MGHSNTLRRIADKLDAGEPPDEVLPILLLLARAMVREEKSKRKP
jgi:hypothetical protein